MLAHNMPEYVDGAWAQYVLSHSSWRDANILYYHQDLRKAIYFEGAETLPAMQFVELEILLWGHSAANTALKEDRNDAYASSMARYWIGVKRAVQLKHPMTVYDMETLLKQRYPTPWSFKVSCQEKYSTVHKAVMYTKYGPELPFRKCVTPPPLPEICFQGCVGGVKYQLIPLPAPMVRPKQKDPFVKEEEYEDKARNPGEWLPYYAKPDETFLLIDKSKTRGGKLERNHVMVISRELEPDQVRSIFMEQLREAGYEYVAIVTQEYDIDLGEEEWELYGKDSQVKCFKAEALPSLKELPRDEPDLDDFQILSDAFEFE